ncbi:hypothetical protein [Clavibacter tessellarius]|uniref:hypothetical protein n=1 Tax=Clavibacter tessellarius TaxID=31965 RepID=UPI003248604C
MTRLPRRLLALLVLVRAAGFTSIVAVVWFRESPHDERGRADPHGGRRRIRRAPRRGGLLAPRRALRPLLIGTLALDGAALLVLPAAVGDPPSCSRRSCSSSAGRRGWRARSSARSSRCRWRGSAGTHAVRDLVDGERRRRRRDGRGRPRHGGRDRLRAPDARRGHAAPRRRAPGAAARPGCGGRPRADR